jgi:alpha-L-arabinofuranosidase
MINQLARRFVGLAGTVLAATAWSAQPAGPVLLRIDVNQVTARVSPTHYGLMTEEINYSYDGGLYAELVRNRSFQDDEAGPVHWTVVQEGGGTGSIALDRSRPLNAARPVALKLEVTAAPGDGRVAVANDGFWGIPVRPNTSYRASFYARGAPGFAGALQVSLESEDGARVHARAEVKPVGPEWRHYEVNLITRDARPSLNNRLVIGARTPGTVWLNQVSLFPPTWRNRPNGNRVDLMQLLADAKPTFLRFPGGNYLQGKTLATRFDWKQTLGDVAARPGHLNDAWGYRSSDGMGLLEFLLWCEELKMKPVLGLFAGFTLRGVPIEPGPALAPYVQEALEEIEYVIGDPSTPWGARRARDGHPRPFPLTYVEVGNEDYLHSGSSNYEGRYAQFYDAIKAKYPQIQVIATLATTQRRADVVDEHFYPREAESFQADATRYDRYDRKGPKIFVGEWATRIGSPTPNLLAAIGDAAWMTGMERNSDLVIMHAYAPLFVNVSDLTRGKGSMQWESDLIGYNALTSYGSPSYYAQKLFSEYRGDVVVAARLENNPLRTWQPPTPRGAKTAPDPKQVAAVYTSVTRDSAKGTLYVKLVNAVDVPQKMGIEVAGVKRVTGGSTHTLAGRPTDTNSVAEPRKVVPLSARLAGSGPAFSHVLPPYSITVLILETR